MIILLAQRSFEHVIEPRYKSKTPRIQSVECDLLSGVLAVVWELELKELDPAANEMSHPVDQHRM
jgi:hypothetical protein